MLEHQPDHSKVLQQLGWLHHQPGAPFADNEKAVQYLTRSLEAGRSGLIHYVQLLTEQTEMTPRAGTSLVEHTWRRSDTTRPTKRTNRQYTETAATPPFGARSVYCITRSTSTETPWTPTRERSDLMPTSVKSGSISEVCTNPATTRSLTPSMPMDEPPNWIKPTPQSGNDFRCCNRRRTVSS